MHHATQETGPTPDDSRDRLPALKAVLARDEVKVEQVPSLGCSIKFRSEGEPVTLR